MNQTARQAFERLLNVARNDTGQSKRVANFVLAWWNAGSCGGFDISDLFSVDEEIASDMAAIFAYVASLSSPEYPEDYRTEIEDIIRRWRPDIWSASQQPE